MGLLLSCTYLHGENNSLQSAFYTDQFIVENHLFIDINIVPVSQQKLIATTFFIVSTIDYMDFNDIIDFMILHCLQGSKPNNAFKTEPCLKNLRTANDWFHMF